MSVHACVYPCLYGWSYLCVSVLVWVFMLACICACMGLHACIFFQIIIQCKELFFYFQFFRFLSLFFVVFFKILAALEHKAVLAKLKECSEEA